MGRTRPGSGKVCRSRAMSRAVSFACAAVLIGACGSQSGQGPKPVPWKDDPGLAPPPLTRPGDASGGPASPAPGAGAKSEVSAELRAAATAEDPRPVNHPGPDSPTPR